MEAAFKRHQRHTSDMKAALKGRQLNYGASQDTSRWPHSKAALHESFVGKAIPKCISTVTAKKESGQACHRK